MTTPPFPGARWWKFDFHTHTPASSDFKDPSCTTEDWLRAFMQKGIDCVAITDHNSGGWIDRLKNDLEKVEQAQPEWYRPMYLFPGVEISVSGGVHLLAIFGPSKGTGDIDSVLGAVDYRGTKGESDDVTQKSLTEVIDLIDHHDGIAIPAHADKGKGLFEEFSGNTLRKIVNKSNVLAVEICDDAYDKPALYHESKVNWAEVRGSDVHTFSSKKFGIFTWVKMETPSIAGLKLALIDGEASTILDRGATPNNHADWIIRSIQVTEAQYMGRGGAPLKCEMSPFLNTIIGGHGSGKSTLLEFMRLALRREDDSPKRLSKNYYHAGNDGLLTDQSILHLIYGKSGTWYLVSWDAGQKVAPIQIWDTTNEQWVEQEGEITSIFPISIYSQKQIYALAEDPQGLLTIIDKAEEVGLDEYQQAQRGYVHAYKSARLQYSLLRQRMQAESKLKGQSNDLDRQIKQIEKSGHKEVLRNYRQRRQQLQEIENTESYWQSLRDSVQESLADFEITEIDEELFAEHPQILATLREKQNQWQRRVKKMQKHVGLLAHDLQQWATEKNQQEWMKSLKDDLRAYQQLKKELQQQGIEPGAYSALIQQRATVEGELKSIRESVTEMDEVQKRASSLLEKLKKSREQLTLRREKFLAAVLNETQAIRIEVIPFGEAWESVENTIRKVLQIDNRFRGDIDHMRAIYENGGYVQLKEHVRNIANEKSGAIDTRFQTYLQNLHIEARTEFNLWLPKDSLNVTYGADRKKLSSGSPGQKSAALLAFILSYGKEPLLLDQPEDDLDHGIISDVIVGALKSNKQQRQIIVVTHNANIVVNGDSEMVHSLTVSKGQTHIESASMQSLAMRKRICNTIEGGEKALAQRYKRIHLEYDHA